VQAFLVDGDGKNFNDWKVIMAAQSPIFKFWDTILSLEKIISERTMKQNVDTLEELVGFFFIFDHYNYAHWLTIHIQDTLAFSCSCTWWSGM